MPPARVRVPSRRDETFLGALHRCRAVKRSRAGRRVGRGARAPRAGLARPTPIPLPGGSQGGGRGTPGRGREGGGPFRERPVQAPPARFRGRERAGAGPRAGGRAGDGAAIRKNVNGKKSATTLNASAARVHRAVT